MIRLGIWARRQAARGLRWVRREWQRWGPAWTLQIIAGDALPSPLPRRAVVLLRDDGEDWSVGMRCPCGCGETIELMLIPEAKPRWQLSIDAKARPSLHPSVWRRTGCRSHFWLRAGRIAWCDSSPHRSVDALANGN